DGLRQPLTRPASLLLPRADHTHKSSHVGCVLESNPGNNGPRIWTAAHHDPRIGKIHKLLLKQHTHTGKSAVADPVHKTITADLLAIELQVHWPDTAVSFDNSVF